MIPSTNLTSSEYEILTVLWSNPDGLTAKEINMQKRTELWKDSSIHLILDKMLKRELVAVGGLERSGKTYSRVFKAAITPEQYALMQVKRNAVYFKDKRIKGFFSALVDSDEISIETITEIEKLLKKKKDES